MYPYIYLYAREWKKVIPKPQPKYKQYLNIILDIGIVIGCIVLFFSQYWWLAILSLLIYSIYMIYKGWDYVEILMSMIDMTVDKYKMVKRLKNAKLKNKRRPNK